MNFCPRLKKIYINLLKHGIFDWWHFLWKLIESKNLVHRKEYILYSFATITPKCALYTWMWWGGKQDHLFPHQLEYQVHSGKTHTCQLFNQLQDTQSYHDLLFQFLSNVCVYCAILQCDQYWMIQSKWLLHPKEIHFL